MDVKDAARILFLEGFKLRRIAEMLRRSENTIRQWSSREDWKGLKVSTELLTKTNAQRVILLIDYQLKQLEKQVKKWEEEQPDKINLISKGDIDALQKLHTTIKRDAKKWSDYVSVVNELLKFTKSHDIELAKDLTEITNLFLNEKYKIM